ncbi:MAG: RNA-binding protein [candidate division Zixibacteria bacterium]|nr:RNA-binding protein [candidate division Zixibacteria bacterium]
MKIYVNNLTSDTVEDDIRKAFGAFGEVERVNIARSSVDGTSRGFGFVDVATEADGRAMISGMNGSDLMGHTLKVNQARRKTGK